MSQIQAQIEFSELSSALFDINDVANSIRRRKGTSCLQQVKGFIESLYPEDCPEDTEGLVEFKTIDGAKLQASINELESFLAELDENTLGESKDDEDSSETIGDCLEDVLEFLKSL